MNPNYSRRNIVLKRKEKTGKKVEHMTGLLAWKAVFICFLAVLVVGSCAAVGIIQGLVDSAPDISGLSVTPQETATYIVDQNGKELQKLTLASSNRTLVTLDEIPLDLQHAIVAIEDQRFYEHHGIDVYGIARAFVKGIAGGRFSEGASTITQQLIKNNVFTDWTSETGLIEKFKRKFQEQYLALELEKTMSKDEILENYLNTINLGAGAYGVQAAAQRYFGKDVSELTLSECAVIAGITQNPTKYNPITYPENNAARRETVLNYMYEQGYITAEQMNEALADDVYERIVANDAAVSADSVYSYYEDALIDQVLKDLQEQLGYSYNKAYSLLYSGGLKIWSAQDAAIQQICDEEFANAENFPAGTTYGIDYALSITTAAGETVNYGNSDLTAYMESIGYTDFDLLFNSEEEAKSAAEGFQASVLSKGDKVLGERISLTPQPQASMVIMDQSTGYVKAIVGGRGEKEASLTLNRATSTTRQPGSTFKIITAYAPALDRFGMTLATVFDNAPYTYTNGTPVNNWDSYNTYTGLTTIREAITNSINIVAVKCITEITPRVGYTYATKLGISTLYNDESLDVSQPLALGGVTDGVTNLELTGAYAAIANGGTYYEPKFYTRIEDADGNVLLSNGDREGEQALSAQTSFLLTSAMTDVVTTGTGTLINLGSMPVAGKTGTTDDYRSVWFSGFTPYYTCTVWGGYDNNDVLPDGARSYHKGLWNAVMTRIHAELEVKSFTQPSGIVTATVCKKSGKLAIPGVCTADARGDMSYTEYFAEGTQPTTYCDTHITVTVCQETGLLPTSTCETTTRVFVQRPAGSTDYTDDSNYAAPTETCAGHEDLSELEEFLNSQTETETDYAEEPITEERRAEENGDSIPVFTEDEILLQ